MIFQNSSKPITMDVIWKVRIENTCYHIATECALTMQLLEFQKSVHKCLIPQQLSAVFDVTWQKKGSVKRKGYKTFLNLPNTATQFVLLPFFEKHQKFNPPSSLRAEIADGSSLKRNKLFRCYSVVHLFPSNLKKGLNETPHRHDAISRGFGLYQQRF